MNCQNITAVLSDLARDQILEASVRNEAIRHCRVCASCARALRDQRALTFALRNLASASQSAIAPETVQHNLVAALRSRTTKHDSSSQKNQWWYRAGAAAAIVLVGFTIGLILRPEDNTKVSQQPPKHAVDKVESGVSKQTAAIVQDPVDTQPSSRPITSKRRGSTARAKQRAEQATFAANIEKYERDEIATEFLPLGYGNALSLQDGGQIVRVEVPRSTLARFGLPVNLDRAEQRVKADLLLGVDGSARAIRFVQ